MWTIFTGFLNLPLFTPCETGRRKARENSKPCKNRSQGGCSNCSFPLVHKTNRKRKTTSKTCKVFWLICIKNSKINVWRFWFFLKKSLVQSNSHEKVYSDLLISEGVIDFNHCEVTPGAVVSLVLFSVAAAIHGVLGKAYSYGLIKASCCDRHQQCTWKTHSLSICKANYEITIEISFNESYFLTELAVY